MYFHALHSCHREGVARGDPLGAGKRMVLSECVDCMHWIAASFASLFLRNDNIKIGRLYGLIFYLRLMSWTKKAYCTYLLANRKNGTVYVGVSGNLSKRMLEHKNGTNEGFTKKYGLKKLVYLESFEVVENAIKREKQLKAGKRSTKIQLIEKDNPNWDDLSADW